MFNKVSLEEDLQKKISKIDYEFEYEDKIFKGSANGKGMVDALWKSTIKKFAKDFTSLNEVKFLGFTATAKLTRRRGSGSDAIVKVVLIVESANKEELSFSHSDCSMNVAAIKVVQEAVEYFINCEKTFLILKDCLRDAQERNRNDLIQKYTIMLAELVKNVSFAKVLKKRLPI